MKVAYRCFGLDNSGYGAAGRGYIRALDSVGFEVDILPFQQGHSIKVHEDLMHLFNANMVAESDAPVVIQHMTPEFIRYYPGKYNVAYSACETSRAPEHWVMPLRACDEVWVPSQWTYDVYTKDHVFSKKGRVIPHGVDVDFFNPRNTPFEALKGYDGFTFGIASDWIERKGGNILLDAFFREFSEDDNVRLVVKGYVGADPPSSSQYIRRRVSEFRRDIEHDADMRGEQKTFAPIELIIDTLSDLDMAHFYAGLDCYAQPSLGEGWGLGFTEAMASGVPVMALRGTGNMEFMTDDNSFLVDAEFVDVPEDKYLKYQNGLYRAPQQWMHPKISNVRKMLRHIVDSADEREKKSGQARTDMEEKWTWEHAGEKIADALSFLGGVIEV